MLIITTKQQNFLIQSSPQNWIRCVKPYRASNRSTLISMILFLTSSRILQIMLIRKYFFGLNFHACTIRFNYFNIKKVPSFVIVGFEVSNKGCCGTGAIEVAVLCNKITSSVCPDVSTHVFWDSYHPTEKTYKVLVSLLINKFVNQFV